MKKFCIVLSQVLAVSAFATQSNENMQSVDSINPQSPIASKTNEWKDIVNKAKISGFGFARYWTINGGNGDGQVMQYRTKVDVTSGKIYGFSTTAGIFFTQGASVPDKDSTTSGAVSGSRAYTGNGFGDRFNFAQIFVSKEFNSENTTTGIDLGKMNLDTVFTNKTVDMGAGGRATITQKIGKSKLTYLASFYDSWNTDYMLYELKNRIGTGAKNMGFGNNLTIVGVTGTNLLDGLNTNLYYANLYGFFNYLFFGDVSYTMKFEEFSLGILAQVSMAGMSSNPHLQIGSGDSNKDNTAYNTQFAQEFSTHSARTRGIFNVALDSTIHNFNAKLGFLGSFGNGYGVSLDSTGSIKAGGKLWSQGYTYGNEGLGLLGSGNLNGSSIYMPYLTLKYTFSNIAFGFDFTYTFGNTYMPILNVVKTSVAGDTPLGEVWKDSTSNNYGTGGYKLYKNPKFFELTPSITYKIAKGFEATFYCAVVVGDINLVKTLTEIKYTF